MLGQSLVDHDVIGMQEVHDAAVAAQGFSEKSDRLLPHRFSQRGIFDMRDAFQAVQAQPLLHEMLRESLGARVGQHAIHLRVQDGRIFERCLSGRVAAVPRRARSTREKTTADSPVPGR